MAVDVRFSAMPELGVPKQLFAVDLFQVGTGNPKRYDISPDGKRFLINSASAAQTAEEPIFASCSTGAGAFRK